MPGSVQSLELLSYKGKLPKTKLFLANRFFLVQTHVKQTRNVGFGYDVLYQNTKLHSSQDLSSNVQQSI